MERFASTKFLLCLGYMVALTALSLAGKPTDEVLKLAESLSNGVLYYCGANMGITMAYALRGDPAKPGEPSKPSEILSPNV